MEQSTANIYRPIPTGADYIEDITALIWPTWVRVQTDEGGDHLATFSVDTSSHPVTRYDLEYMFNTWLGCHVVEHYSGQTVFEGFVYSMRLMSGGNVWTISLENVANHVRVLYQPDSASASAISSAVQDTGSQAVYGTKQIILQPRGYHLSAAATAMGNAYLARYSLPRAFSGDLVPDPDPAAILEVELRGYVHTLAWKYENVPYASASTVGRSTHLGNLLTGLDYVTAGSIATDATNIWNEVEYTTTLDHISNLLAGVEYSWGCLAGRAFDYKARDLTNIRYRRRAFDGVRRLTRRGLFVPSPLVTPGGIIWTEDVFAGRPASSTLLDDPRAIWVQSVEYSIDGVRITTGEDTDDAWQNAGAVLALAKEFDIYAIQSSGDPALTGGGDPVVLPPPGRIR